MAVDETRWWRRRRRRGRRRRRKKLRDLLRSRALLYLVSKASASDWEYHVTPYIVTFSDPSVVSPASSSRYFLCSVFRRRLPETIYCSWPVVTRVFPFLRRNYGAFERWNTPRGDRLVTRSRSLHGDGGCFWMNGDSARSIVERFTRGVTRSRVLKGQKEDIASRGFYLRKKPARIRDMMFQKLDYFSSHLHLTPFFVCS